MSERRCRGFVFALDEITLVAKVTNEFQCLPGAESTLAPGHKAAFTPIDRYSRRLILSVLITKGGWSSPVNCDCKVTQRAGAQEQAVRRRAGSVNIFSGIQWSR